MNKSQKNIEVKKEDGVELESQYILRLPEEPAKILREAIQTGVSNLKDRLLIKLEQDIRYGEVRLDNYFLHAKVVDLPTVIESLKTIDNKSFYKTADICQIMICSEEAELPAVEEESPNKAKKKDPNKVEKKFLWPHGVTPPCKNVRKRRFRKTLKKKYVEAPEIEKEVKRLLRIDNDAVNVKYEIINEDDENLLKGEQLDNISKDETFTETDEDKLDDSFTLENNNKTGNDTIDSDGDQEGLTERPSNLVEHDIHDIFGGEVSSSDDEGNHHNDKALDNSRFSNDDSHLSDFSVGRNDDNNKSLTEFNKSMFGSSTSKENLKDFIDSEDAIIDPNDPNTNYYGDERDKKMISIEFDYIPLPQMTKEEINTKILELRKQCEDLKILQNQKSNEVSSISNQTLKQRLQETVDNLLSQIVEKELEIQDYHNLLQSIASASN